MVPDCASSLVEVAVPLTLATQPQHTEPQMYLLCSHQKRGVETEFRHLTSGSLRPRKFQCASPSDMFCGGLCCACCPFPIGQAVVPSRGPIVALSLLASPSSMHSNQHRPMYRVYCRKARTGAGGTMPTKLATAVLFLLCLIGHGARAEEADSQVPPERQPLH